ncbi:hypothetical protein ACNKHS_16980 [Shigella flexneri]
MDASLKRQQTDYLDLYRCTGRSARRTASVSLATPGLEAPAASCSKRWKRLRSASARVDRYIGVSNETAFGVMRYLHLADKHDLPRIVTIQNPYSLPTAVMKWVWREKRSTKRWNCSPTVSGFWYLTANT